MAANGSSSRSFLGRIWSGLKSWFLGNDDGKGDGASATRGPDPRAYLAGAIPGAWASDHMAEARQCKGWQFVAVSAVGKMCSQAELAVHHVGLMSEQKRRVRRAFRLAKMIRDRRRIRQFRAMLAAFSTTTAKAGGGATPNSTAQQQDRRPVDADHPLYRLMQRPNPEWSLPTFLFVAAQQISLTATCLVWRVRDPILGVPIELYILPTGAAIPCPPSEEFPHGSYTLLPQSPTPASWGSAGDLGAGWVPGFIGQVMSCGCEIDARDVKPIRWPHPLYLSDGLSPLAAGAVCVDVSNEIDRAFWHNLQNSEKPGMTFGISSDVDPDPADVAQFREDLRAESAGVSNTGKHLLLPKGVEPKDRGRTPAEMDYAAARPQYRDMSLALHSVSPVAAGITEAGSHGMYWAAVKQTTELVIQPLLSLIAGELTEFLGSEFDGPRCEIGLAARAIDDPQLLENRLRTDIQAGNVLRVNEYRAMRKLPPISGPDGMQFVGQKVTVRAEDGDPEKPGVQRVRDNGNGDSGNGGGDDPSRMDEVGTGTRDEMRDDLPGQRDRSDKGTRAATTASRNGRHGGN